jgi:hypothetical protein
LHSARPAARRPDRVVPAARALVVAQLGPGFTEAPPLDLGACLADSAPGRPLIFVLSPGADPMAALGQLAAARGLPTPASVSLGQGQGGRAAALVATGAAAGAWVVLQVRARTGVCWLRWRLPVHASRERAALGIIYETQHVHVDAQADRRAQSCWACAVTRRMRTQEGARH